MWGLNYKVNVLAGVVVMVTVAKVQCDISDMCIVWSVC